MSIVNKSLKVIEFGDRANHRQIPKITLTGKWLAEAGINYNTRVQITNPASGVLVITLIQEK